MAADTSLLRIGELSRRLGLSPHVLRAWERRYGLPRPTRSSGGYRLYSEADEHRLRAMQAHLADGLSAAEAARAALEDNSSPPAAPAAQGLVIAAQALTHAFEGFDEPWAQEILDRLLIDFTVETVLRDVLLPFLRESGERWCRGELTVAQEHFATHVIRDRLAALGRGCGRGRGPRAVLACPPGELHDIPLLAFGVMLFRNGWRVAFLGASVPVADLIRTVEAAAPRLVVMSAVDPVRFAGLGADLARLAALAPLALAGEGASEAVARASSARLLTGDPVTEAARLSRPA
jgi:MerR family transcriptional regulator, light-induced transcriptional regulator